VGKKWDKNNKFMGEKMERGLNIHNASITKWNERHFT
jgi:hypothetical protein